MKKKFLSHPVRVSLDPTYVSKYLYVCSIPCCFRRLWSVRHPHALFTRCSKMKFFTRLRIPARVDETVEFQGSQ